MPWGIPLNFGGGRRSWPKSGLPVLPEFLALKDPRFSRPFFTGPDHPPGTLTDDTQMTIAVAEALLTAGSEPLDGLMEEMGRRFVRWANSEDKNRSPGGACMQGCDNLTKGLPWRQAGIADSKGYGAAMRVAPIGLYYADLNKIQEVAEASSLLTHGHSAAVASAAAAALGVSLARQGAEPPEMYSEIAARCCPLSEDFASIWTQLPSHLESPPERVLIEGALGEGWVAEEAVASAMYCFWRSPNNYKEAVLAAINTDGDSDSIGAITGSFAGAQLGIRSIPAVWRTGVEASDYLHDLGKRLWDRRFDLARDFE